MSGVVETPLYVLPGRVRAPILVLPQEGDEVSEERLAWGERHHHQAEQQPESVDLIRVRVPAELAEALDVDLVSQLLALDAPADHVLGREISSFSLFSSEALKKFSTRMWYVNRTRVQPV